MTRTTARMKGMAAAAAPPPPPLRRAMVLIG